MMVDTIQNLLFRVNDKIVIDNCTSEGLIAGKLGVIAFYESMANVLDRSIIDQAENELEKIFLSFNNEESQLTNYNYSFGLTGLAYITTLFERANHFEIDLNDLLEPLDEMFYRCALEDLRNRRVDFLHQAGGVLHYFQYRLPNKKIAEYLNELVGIYLTNAVVDEQGFRYEGSLPYHTEHAKGVYDFGLAHGMSGQLIILCNLYQNGIQQERIKEMLGKGWQFLNNYKRAESDFKNQPTLYPHSVYLEDLYAGYSDRLAWCYGDLNLLLLLYKLKPILKSPTIQNAIDELNYYIVSRTQPKENHIVDSHFCHGTAGVAQLYKSIHELSDKEFHLEAYHYWIDQTLKYLDDDLEKETFKGKEHELLDGLTGTGLVLLSFLAKKRLNWENIFLL